MLATRFMFISYKGDLHGSNMLMDFFYFLESIVCLYFYIILKNVIALARLIKENCKKNITRHQRFAKGKSATIAECKIKPITRLA